MPVLFSVSPLDPSTGLRVDLRFCNVDDPRVTGLNDLMWWPGVGRAPALNREAFNGNWLDSVSLAQAIITLYRCTLVKHDPNAPLYRYAGAPVQVLYAPARDAVWAEYTLIFAGLVTDYGLTSNGDFRLTCSVDSADFEESLLETKYLGTGGAEGPEDLKDKVKPAVFGYAKNVEPVMINTVDNVFQVHGYGAIQDVVKVYERAADFGASVGDYATYDALVAAAIPEGRWGTCKAQGMFRLGAPPFGLITADVEGDNVGGFHQTTAAIIERLCTIRSVDPARIDAVSMAAFEAAMPQTVNLYLTAPVRLMDIIQELAKPCNAQASLSWTGVLQVTRFGSIPAPGMTLDAQGRQLPPVIDCEEQGVAPPYWRMEMQADRCWRVHSKDEIAFEDEDPVPQTVYRRYPVKPDTPTGNAIPADWATTVPGYSVPVNVNSFDQFGPVWQSLALQRHNITDENGWSEPVIADPLYPGWSLVSQNVGAKVLGTANALKATDDFDPATDDWPFCFINRPVAGSFTLQCKVRGELDRVAIGVVAVDPAVLNDGWLVTDIKYGVYIAQDDAYATRGPDGENATGAFIVQNYDPNSDLGDGRQGVVLEVPIANCAVEMSYNGETIEFYVDGERVRTSFVDNSIDGIQYHAVIMPLSADAEIYDIIWGRGTQARELDFRLDFGIGCLRRSTHQNGWETYMPAINSGASCGSIYSKTFADAVFVSFKIGAFATGTVADTITRNVVHVADVGTFTFYSDGTFDAQKYNDDIIETGVWSAGDSFGLVLGQTTISTGFGTHTTTKLLFLQNGVLLSDRKLPHPDSSLVTVDLGAGGLIYDISIMPQGPSLGTAKGTANSEGLLTPISDTTVAVSGFIVVATTPDIPYNAPNDNEDVVASAQFKYTKTAGAAASFTPQAKLQKSFDAGATWSDSGSPVTGSASTGSLQSLDISATDAVSGTGTVRYRLMIQNTVAGAYTATTSGYLTAQWAG